MRAVVIFLYLFNLISINARSQDATGAIYFQRINDSVIEFYYDANYYLVDKDCEFRFITRRAGFNKTNSTFSGSFTDTDRNGSIILEGTYRDGRKNGKFVAYHPNRVKKWEVDFRENRPLGNWSYFYPDGKPLLNIAYTDSTTSITSLWDRKGQMKVRNGTGSYEFKNLIDGYSEYGYTFINARGRVKNGVPINIWNIYYQNNEPKSKVEAAQEFYRNGKLVSGDDYFKDEDYVKPRFPILPQSNFFRAEALTFKQCNYDDFIGFRGFVSEYLTSFYHILFFENKTEAAQTGKFSIKFLVDKRGRVMNGVVSESQLAAGVNLQFERAIKAMDYFVPSFNDEGYIDDEIILHGEIVQLDSGHNTIIVQQIVRKNETN